MDINKSSNTSQLEKCPSETENIGKADVCQACPGRELCLSNSAGDPDQKYVEVRMKAIKKKIMIMSGKGGVGKSTMAACIAIALSKLNYKVGVADLDLCGPSLPLLLGVSNQQVVNSSYGWKPAISPHYNIKIISSQLLLNSEDGAIAWRGPRKTNLIKNFVKDVFWGRLDYLLFDLPPGTSDEHLSSVKILKTTNLTGVILVTTPHKICLQTVSKSADFCIKMGIPILGIIENMSHVVCSFCNEKTEIFPQFRVADSLSKEFGVPLLGRIPLDTTLRITGDESLEKTLSKVKSSAMKEIENLIENCLLL